MTTMYKGKVMILESDRSQIGVRRVALGRTSVILGLNSHSKVNGNVNHNFAVRLVEKGSLV